MDERLGFVARLLDGEKMAVECREFGISRKTGYKLFNRYKNHRLRGLKDRARSPYRHSNKLPFQVETAILRIKREHTSWGAPKIREKLVKAYPRELEAAAFTVVLYGWIIGAAAEIDDQLNRGRNVDTRTPASAFGYAV
jgi:putative transposase